jgi:hypothetical protein
MMGMVAPLLPGTAGQDGQIRALPGRSFQPHPIMLEIAKHVQTKAYPNIKA